MTGTGLRGRRIAWLMLCGVVALDALVALLFVSAPNMMGPMRFEPPSRLVLLVPAIGIAAHIVGLAWMVRIIRTDPEARASSWRFNRA